MVYNVHLQIHQEMLKNKNKKNKKIKEKNVHFTKISPWESG
jgi:hypothetical protein